MTIQADIKVIGIKQALKDLNKINPKLRRQITKDYAKIVKPVTDAAVQAVPDIAPISGWESGWTFASGYNVVPAAGWNGIKAQRLIKPKISTRRVKTFRGNLENLGTFRVVWTGMANTVYDIAGRKSRGTVRERSRMGSHGRKVGTVGGPTMIAVLRGRYGGASRTIWDSYEKNKDKVSDEMQDLVDNLLKGTFK